MSLSILNPSLRGVCRHFIESYGHVTCRNLPKQGLITSCLVFLIKKIFIFDFDTTNVLPNISNLLQE